MDVLYKISRRPRPRLQPFEKSLLGRKPGCSLPDHRLQDRSAKPLQMNALGPKLSCSLQDGPSGASGHSDAEPLGFFSRTPDVPRGIVSGNRGFQPAISADCHGRPVDTRDPQELSAGGTHVCAGSGTAAGCRSFAGGENGKGRIPSHNRGTGARLCSLGFPLRPLTTISERIRSQNQSRRASIYSSFL